MSAYVKQPGGQFSTDVRQSIFDYLDFYLPDWKDYYKTIALPIIPDPKFVGPLQKASGSLGQIKGRTEEMYLGLKRSHDAEMAVLRALKCASEQSSLGLRLFHDLPISESKLNIIKQCFSTVSDHDIDEQSLLKTGDNEMCDVLILSRSTITLVEVKASVGTAKAALDKAKKSGGRKPLTQGILFLRMILRALKISKNIKISQILAIPNCPRHEIERKLGKREEYCYLGLEDLRPENAKKLGEMFISDSVTGPLLTDSDLMNLTASCVLLLVGMVNKANEETLLKILKEGEKGSALSTEILQQVSLEAVFEKQQSIAKQKNKFKQVEQIFSENISSLTDRHKIISVRDEAAYSAITSEILFFTPEQARILLIEPNPKQIIFGPAATGKTLLIQAKAINLVKTGEPVLIILPESLCPLYEAFFDRVLSEDKHEMLKILSLEYRKNLPVIVNALEHHSWHLLVDEYYAIVSNEACDKNIISTFHQLIVDLPSDRVCWIAIDPLQPMDEKNFAPDIQIPGMTSASLSFLLTVQRCTNSVFLQWNKHCGKFVSLGHQNEGVYAETEYVPRFDDYHQSIDAIAQSIAHSARKLVSQNWKEKDIVILIDNKLMSHGWEAEQELWACLKTKLTIHTLGQTAKTSKSIATNFTHYANLHSFEWLVVICARTESDYDEFTDYVVRSRAIFKLVILQFPEVINPNLNPYIQQKVASQEGGDGGFLKNISRHLYIAYYDMMACEQFLITCPHLICSKDLTEVLISPLQWISEGTVFYFAKHFFEAFEEKLKSLENAANLLSDLHQVNEALQSSVSMPLTLLDIRLLNQKLEKRKQASNLFNELLRKGIDSYKPVGNVSFDNETQTFTGQLPYFFWHEVPSRLFFGQILTKKIYWISNCRRLLQVARSHFSDNALIANLETAVELIEKNLEISLVMPTVLGDAAHFEQFKEILVNAICGLYDIARHRNEGNVT